MTIDKRENVTIPVWLISIIMSLLIAGFTAWGLASAKAAAAEIRLEHIEKDMSKKVNKDEMNMVINRLDRIERKIDQMNPLH